MDNLKSNPFYNLVKQVEKDNPHSFLDYFSKSRREKTEINRFEKFSELVKNSLSTKDPKSEDFTNLKYAYEDVVERKWKAFSTENSPEYGVYSSVLEELNNDVGVFVLNTLNVGVEAFKNQFNLDNLKKTLPYEGLNGSSAEKLQAKIKSINSKAVDQWYTKFAGPFQTNDKAIPLFKEEMINQRCEVLMAIFKEIKDTATPEQINVLREEFRKLGKNAENYPKMNDLRPVKTTHTGDDDKRSATKEKEDKKELQGRVASDAIANVVVTETLKVAAKTPVVVAEVKRRELSASEKNIATVNASWFLQLDDFDSEKCTAVVNKLYDKSKSEVALSKEEWLTFARGLDLLLKQNPADTGLKAKAKDVFERFYLHAGEKNKIPQEYGNLYAHLQGEPEFLKKLEFISQYVEKRTEEQKEADPNCLAIKANLDAFFPSSSLEACDFKFRGFPTDDKTNYSEGILGLADKLKSNPKLEDSDTVKKMTLVLAYAMQCRQLKDEKGVKLMASLKALHPKRINDFIEKKTLGPISPEEQKQYSDFLQIYKLFTQSNFLQREGPSGYGKWGYFLSGKEKILAGNEKGTTLSDFTTGLNQAKDALLAEQNTKKVVPVAPHKFEIELSKLMLSEPQEVLSWDAVFAKNSIEPSEADISQGAWNKQTVAVREQATTLYNQYYDKITPPIDFDILMQTIEQGKMPPTFLKMFGDQGVNLMQQYLFPYVVMQKRAGVEYHDPVAKFIASPASPKQLAELGGKEPAKQANVLTNAISLMREGGPLERSAIHTEQVDMLRKMIVAIRERKPQTISSDTGMGKTFTSKLASRLISIDVPAIHVAPFPSTEEGWVELKSWDQLQNLEGPAPNFWVTTDGLKGLMGSIPEQARSSLKDCLFYMDEYDSPAYLFDKAGGEVSTLQNEIYFGCNSGRIVNMSATTNISELESKIERYQMKLSREGGDKYQQRIDELYARLENLKKNIAIEMAREIAIKPAKTDFNAQIDTIFEEFKPADGPSSYLIELPDKTLGTDSNELTTILNKSAEKFSDRAVAVLWRDHVGSLKARVKKGESDSTISLEEFDKQYETDSNMVTVCVYTRDCVGGDFGAHSNDAFVKGQCIVYEGDSVEATHVVYQNMRRMRSGLESDRKQFPVTVYVSNAVNSQIEGNKTTFLEKADKANEKLAATQELNRLQIKTVRKKEQLFHAVIEQDLQKFVTQLRSKSNPAMGKAISNLETIFKKELMKVKIDINTDIEELRKKVWDGIIQEVTKPPEIEKLSQENQIYMWLADIMPKPIDTGSSQKQKDDFYEKDFKTFIRTNIYPHRGKAINTLDIWTNALKVKLSDPTIRNETVRNVLDKLSKDRSVRLDQALKNEDFVPDYFYKATLGGVAKGVEANAFLNKLKEANIKAQEKKAEIDTSNKNNAECIEFMKQILNPTNLPSIEDMEEGTVPTMRENLDWYKKALEAVPKKE